jgi:hypothetical protein
VLIAPDPALRGGNGLFYGAGLKPTHTTILALRANRHRRLEASKLNAQEYAARKLGQINSKLDRLIELLEKLNAKT